MTAFLLTCALWIRCDWPPDQYDMNHARLTNDPAVIEFQIYKYSIPKPSIWGDDVTLRVDLPGKPQYVTVHNSKALGLAWNPFEKSWESYVVENEETFWGTATSNKVKDHYVMDVLYCGRLPELRITH